MGLSCLVFEIQCMTTGRTTVWRRTDRRRQASCPRGGSAKIFCSVFHCLSNAMQCMDRI